MRRVNASTHCTRHNYRRTFTKMITNNHFIRAHKRSRRCISKYEAIVGILAASSAFICVVFYVYVLSCRLEYASSRIGVVHPSLKS